MMGDNVPYMLPLVNSDTFGVLLYNLKYSKP